MSKVKKYEFFDGKKVLGYYSTSTPISGKFLIIPAINNENFEFIKVPILYRKIYDDGVDITFRICLNVIKKSKRQIKLLLNRNTI